MTVELELQKKIDAVSVIANRDDCAITDLADALADLTKSFESSGFLALSFVTDTAATSCSTGTIEVALARLGVIDLLVRALESLESHAPFNLDDAEEPLKRLLFPTETTPAEIDDDSTNDSSFDELNLGRSNQNLIQESPEAKEDDSLNQTFSESGPLDLTDCKCDDEDLLSEFIRESTEHLDSAEQLLLLLESNPNDSEAIHGMFRAVHSLKGTSGVLDMASLGEVSHIAESALVKVREGEHSLQGNLFESILLAVDFIGKQIRALEECYQAKRSLEYPLPPIQLIQCLQEADQTGTCEDLILKQAKSRLERCDSEESLGQSVIGGNKKQADSLRVDAVRLEQLIDLIGELVITESAVQRELTIRNDLSSASISSRLRKVVRDVQELSLALKMVPIGSLFQKMNRLVRDISTKLDKSTQLVIEGGDTEVDKTLMEQIADPLVHLLRNSLDHGIETLVSDRVAVGKPEVATIRLSATHRAGNIHISISDDGRGLDRQRILARAIDRGLVPSRRTLSEEEIDQLIFSPGFSTASEVSEISGRGVGMDVVRKNIESLRGTIHLISNPGQGTEIRLELPMTLSIIDGTVVRIDDRCFIVPTLSVIEQIQPDCLELSSNQRCTMARFRDHFIVTSHLGEILGHSSSTIPNEGQSCLVVEAGGRSCGLIVDEVVGQQAIVIKPLGAVLDGFELFAGGALLPDGDVAFVLDLHAVCRSHTRISQERLESGAES